MRPLKSRQVEAFRAVMICGSMTEAARQLQISQPGISRLIADLEESTGLHLFERLPGRIEPTEEARAFYREVERSFTGLDRLAQAARNIRFFGSGRLRIATLHVIGLSFLPRVIRRFKEEWPEVTISLHIRAASTVVQWAVDQQCDIGIATNVPDVSSVEIQPFSELPGVCVLPAGHRLADRRKIYPDDLAGESFISLALEDNSRRVIDGIFETANVQRITHIETQYVATICAMVCEGLGVSIVNPLALPDYLHRGLVARRFEPAMWFYSKLLFPTHRPRSRLVDAFVTTMRGCLAEEMSAIDRLLERE